MNSNASFRLNLTGSPMPQMSCWHNGKQVIFCSSEDMKDVMYDNPSRPCNSTDLHYQIRSEKVQTSYVDFDIINVTFARDNGSTIYCNWENDYGKKNFVVKIVVTGKGLYFCCRRRHRCCCCCCFSVDIVSECFYCCS